MPCCGEVSVTGYVGTGSIGSPLVSYRTLGSFIRCRTCGFMRQDLRQEPYAVTPPVRIRAGGGGQPSSLPHPVFAWLSKQSSKLGVNVACPFLRVAEKCCL